MHLYLTLPLLRTERLNELSEPLLGRADWEEPEAEAMGFLERWAEKLPGFRRKNTTICGERRRDGMTLQSCFPKMALLRLDRQSSHVIAISP